MKRKDLIEAARKQLDGRPLRLNEMETALKAATLEEGVEILLADSLAMNKGKSWSPKSSKP